MVVSRRNPATGEPIEEDSKLQTVKHEDEKKRAFVLRKKVFDDKFAKFQNDNSSEIDIINPDLWNLLKKHLGDYPYHIFRDSPVTLYSPYENIVFEFDALRAASQHSPQDETEAMRVAREDLGRLLNVISGGDSGDAKLDKYFKMRPNYKRPNQLNKAEPETIQFTDLWTVFPPGTLVYGRPFQNEHQVFVVKDNAFPWPERSTRLTFGRQYDPWELDAWTYDWKDGSFRRSDFTLKFEEFEGHLPLTSLPYYPFDMKSDSDAIRKDLIQRGHKFRAVCEAKEGQRLFEYGGLAISEHKGFSGMKYDSPVSRYPSM